MQINTVTPVGSSELIQGDTPSENLPEILKQVAYLRIWQICDCKKPGVNPLLPISRTTFLNGVRSGKFPSAKKIGRTRCWAAGDIKQLIIKLGQAA